MPVKYTEGGKLASMVAVPLFRMLGRPLPAFPPVCLATCMRVVLHTCLPTDMHSSPPLFLQARFSPCLYIFCLLKSFYLQKISE